MEPDWLADRFEAQPSQLRAVAYRMLGSASDADDAVQEAWIRLSRSDADSIDNLAGWLTPVVAGVPVDMWRARSARGRPAGAGEEPSAADPEAEVMLADS